MARLGAVLLLPLLALLAAPPARACTLDDVDGSLSRDTLTHYFPDALSVLARVVEMRRAGGLPPSPGLTPTPLHIRSLMGLASRLDKQWRAAAGETPTPPIAVLLIESMLWARLPALPSTSAADLHAQGPADGDLVIITSEDVVRQIVAGKLVLAEAQAQGLVRLYGPQARQSELVARLAKVGRVPKSP